MRTIADYEGEGAFVMSNGYRNFVVPEHMREGLVSYVERRVMPGDFLRAIIENNLHEAVARADGTNIEQLPAFVNFFYNHAPSPCWGSPASMKAWLAGRQSSRVVG